MANRRVSLVRAVKFPGEKAWDYLAPVVSDKGTPSPEWCMKAGEKVKVSGLPTVWYISWYQGRRRMKKNCGKFLHEAVAAKMRQERLLAATNAGLEVKEEHQRTRISDAFNDFLEDQKFKGLQDETIQAYRLVTEGFLKSCDKTYVDQLEKRDLLRYADACRKQGLHPRTVSNRFVSLQTALKASGVPKLVEKKERPRYVKEVPEAYSREQVEKLFAAATGAQRLLFEFYLKTGFRMQEVMFTSWGDIDFVHHTVKVTPKLEHDFVPKSWEVREIPLGEGLATRLQGARRNRKASALVFPTRHGNANNKHLQALKRLAKRSGQNPVDFFLHKFRATYATWNLQAGIDIRTVQLLLGHKELESTMRYLAPAKGKELNAKVAATFAGV